MLENEDNEEHENQINQIEDARLAEEKKNAKKEEQEKKDFNHWYSKIARYLAYCVDGGVLCSQFTLTTLIQFLDKVNETGDEKKINDEISYLLHIRKIGKDYVRATDSSISS